jgi:two-component system, cell cycle sensor histidine kinase and response regulator CckA
MEVPPIKVLLVDDDEDDYIITRDLIGGIRDRGYELDWVSSYEEGSAAIRRAAHDLFLCDYRLGGRTGLELLREAQQSHCCAPLILLTGQGDRAIDEQAMKAGAADYLVKGQITSDTLERAMRYAIQKRRAEEHLRRDRDLITRMMATSPVGIVTSDHAGRITFANHRAEQVLGLVGEELARRIYSVLDWRLTDLDGKPIPDQTLPLKYVLETGEPVQDSRHALDRPGGQRVLISANAAPLLDASGKVDGLVVTVEDITDRLNLEAQLRQSQKMESVGQLAAGVAHDINNVLTVIQGHVGLLLKAAPANADSGKSLRQVAAAAERAARFIRQLLMFSRKQVIQSRVLDLNAVLHSLENMLPRMLGEDVGLETCYFDRLPAVEADTGMIEQIVMNLAVNARDAMPKGGRLRIETSVVTMDAARVRQHAEARPGEFVCLTVSDTGWGMDHHVLQHIFEPFFSTKEVGKGTGLGLATVYGIVKQHHGWIEVESEPGAGTTFRVFLPPATEPQNSTFDSGHINRNVNGGSESVLIVEDEPGLRELMRKILGEFHYHVVAAASGVEALRLWDEFNGKFDLLLTDMIMPGGMTGSELAAELRRRHPGLKIIYSSGYSSELVGKDLGHSEIPFIAKPYLPDQLARIVRDCLDGVVGKPPTAVPS